MKMFVYGDVDCRGIQQFRKGHIELDHVAITQELVENDKEEELDDFLDTVSEEKNYMVDALNLLAVDANEDPELLSKLENGEVVHVMGEEELYGIGLTKKLAKEGYLKGLEECGDSSGGDW